MPFPPWRDWGWFDGTWRTVMDDPVGLPRRAAILFAVGSISIFLRRWQLGLMLHLPILLTLMASALHKYPFAGRLLLFLVPNISLIVAEFIGRIYSLLQRNKRLSWIGLPVALVVFAWVVRTPASEAWRHLSQPRLGEEMKPVMAYLGAQRQQNDAVYVYYGAAPAFRFYSPLYDLNNARSVWGTQNRLNREGYIRELDQLRGRGRTWVVISHNCDWNGFDEKALIVEHLDHMGRRLDQFIGQNSSAYLYDL